MDFISQHSDMKSILICTNGKMHAQEAIRFVGEMFGVQDPEITLLYVEAKEQTEDKEIGKEIFKKGVAVLHKLGIIHVQTMERQAETIAGGIAEEIQEGSYDLLVIGSRGSSDTIPGVSQYVLGDVPREVILETDISTFTIPEPQLLRKILIAVDGSPESKEVVEFWGSIEQEQRKVDSSWNEHRIVLLNVIPELYERFSEFLNPLAESQLEALETLPGKRTQSLYEAKEIIKKYGVTAKIRLREGDVAEEILKESERDYDLIVMRRSSRKKYSLGPYTKRVLEKSKIPVLTIKT